MEKTVVPADQSRGTRCRDCRFLDSQLNDGGGWSHWCRRRAPTPVGGLVPVRRGDQAEAMPVSSGHFPSIHDPNFAWCGEFEQKLHS